MIVKKRKFFALFSSLPHLQNSFQKYTIKKEKRVDAVDKIQPFPKTTTCQRNLREKKMIYAYMSTCQNGIKCNKIV